MNRFVSRRTFLRGAGVALTLPWFESLAPRSAFGQAAAGARIRYLPIFLPNGSSENFRPPSAGQGMAWQLSGVLEPLKDLKSKMIVLTGMENGTAFNANGSSSVEPSHGRQPGAWLTCIDPGIVRMQVGGGVTEANRISLDQTMAKTPGVVGNTPVKSMQVGLSTWYSNCDQHPCSNSRTVSWDATGKPMYKSVDPLEVFNKIAGVVMPGPAMPGTGPDPLVLKRAALNKSVLDAVMENAARTQLRLGTADRLRLDQFLTHVRTVEKSATTLSGGMGGLAACVTVPKPMGAMILPDKAKTNSATYNKGTHADVMNDLIVMAFQCDATRVITYMLEDERSEFSYSHVPRRTFTTTSSSPGSGVCGEYHNNGQHGAQDEFATISWWNAGKVAALATKLNMIMEGERSILDNSVIWFSGPMHGSNHSCSMIPMTLIGGGGGKLKTDQHVVFTKRWLRDLHVTLMKEVYGMSGPGVDDFGITRADNPYVKMTEILNA